MLSALRATGAKVTPNAPLKRRAYWGCGGPAQYLVEPKELAQLQAIMALGQPVTVLGRGSNSLIHDDGITGLVLQLKGQLAALEIQGEGALVGAGLRLSALLSRLDRAGLGGAESLSGVPGTMGGAVVMNAGTRLGEAKECITQVTVVLPGGALRVLQNSELHFGYRSATLPPGAVVALAQLTLNADPGGARVTQREEFLARRKATQPLDKPSCGSTFVNPPGDSAGRLIQACGLKGHRIGGAQISELHANFFLNTGGATAEQLRQLIVHARRTVFEQTGVLLRPEVRLLGEWGLDPLGI